MNKVERQIEDSNENSVSRATLIRCPQKFMGPEAGAWSCQSMKSPTIVLILIIKGEQVPDRGWDFISDLAASTCCEEELSRQLMSDKNR
jgi:hypothetical protein